MNIYFQILISVGIILIGYFIVKKADKQKFLNKDILILFGFLLIIFGLYSFAYGLPGTKEARESYESRQVDKDYGAGFY